MVLGHDVGGNGEVRVAVEVEVLAPDRGRGQRRRRPGRLSELDDPRPGCGCRDRAFERLAAQRIEDIGRLAKVTVEADRLVGAELERSLQAGRIPARRHDVARAQQPRRLHRDLPHRPGRPEHEHPVAFP